MQGPQERGQEGRATYVLAGPLLADKARVRGVRILARANAHPGWLTFTFAADHTGPLSHKRSIARVNELSNPLGSYR